MKQISILVTHQALIAAIGNARYMFMKVNNFLKKSGKTPLFDVQLVGITQEVRLDQGLFTIKADAVLHEVHETDLVIIPPMDGDMEHGIQLNEEYIPWIKQQYKQGAEIASLCVGAFLLAETGLLKGKSCPTHWQTAHEFRMKFPDIHLVDDKIITDHHGLYTSGGANSYWNLLVYLVEKYTNRNMAIRTSKYFEVEMNRDNQSSFVIFEGCKTHDDEVVQTAQKYIEHHYQQKITIDQLSNASNLARRTFQRRFKKATHYTVLEYIQNVKVEAAKKLLESNQLTVNEAMFEVGYQDPKAFRDTFKKIAGMTPQDYKNRYLHADFKIFQ